MDMMSCKSGSWWELNPQRGRANNSVILKRGEVDSELFFKIWETIKQSGAGEPGFYWTDDDDSFTNPCGEIRLDPFQFCNLTEINGSDIKNQEEFNKRAEVASIIGTLQATYTDFHYLRPCWKDQTEKDFLIGVGITGIASKDFLDLDHIQAAKIVKETNEKYAGLLGIKPASRTTTVKPSGTSSLVVGSSSGIHAWHNDYYIRRMRIGKNESLYNYLLENFPDLIEDCVFKPHLEAVISFPQKAPDNAILRTESVFDFLDRIEHFNRNWVRVGSRNADKHNNVSCTVSLNDDDWGPVGEWMWTNREVYNGISVIPYDGGTYVQTPFEDCTEEKYLELMSHLKSIDLSKVIEIDDNTNLNDQIACAGGACII
jgi:ribonucleoside-diphosphate reductase alpha chain